MFACLPKSLCDATGPIKRERSKALQPKRTVLKERVQIFFQGVRRVNNSLLRFLVQKLTRFLASSGQKLTTSVSAVSGPEIDSVSGQKLTPSVSAVSEAEIDSVSGQKLTLQFLRFRGAETESVSGQKLTLQFLFTPVPETEVPYILNF